MLSKMENWRHSRDLRNAFRTHANQNYQTCPEYFRTSFQNGGYRHAPGTHSMRRTKVAHIYGKTGTYRKTGNLWAVQLLLGHTKMDSTVRYLWVELDDALAISESVEI